ncbi:stage II sporulation protein M [Staphylococcus pettenkoferi]|uniref:stage II sporulation protein M n=1 Tax=Staphylococcus pettenkoferi TaxID=170573 RepID=UPI0011A90A83|nr:stage II sporulation protein M [Staphylococcus pettenkoferi]MCY1591264.1 stage II sporulation protein M [Staphylococcus pettenkoferi]MCY1593441.1 stage II sporulation protein M [Staphylococcus pettenkoferi]MCY1598197.1 stage II sporulation protein M [Staphylococcus pettenkoferi]MCY1599888.1 stage II sporulation protein M [Staphylococcus pettenkoferi]MCY1601193.1 stage II sporulation protein M [Staphylococcus pettenkoferi]
MIFFVGVLLGVMIYFFLDVDLGEMYLNDDITIKEIFINNFIYFLVSILGFLSIGIVNIGLLIINGGMIGFFFAHCLKSNQLLKFFLYLGPHAVLEILVLILTSAFSFYTVVFAYKRIIKKQKIKGNLIKRFLLTFFLSCVLLFIAAVIETYFKPF